MRPNRMIGMIEGADPSGPTVVVTAGLHGNEPAGIRALERVFTDLERRKPTFRGRIIGFRGNTRALAARRRYIDRDLNRCWSPGTIASLFSSRRHGAPLSTEDTEQLELLDAFVPYLRSATTPIVFLDLHSTSGEGPPFVCMADVLRNRPISFSLPIPVVLGLEEVIEGSMLGYLCDLGHVGIAIEGGQHDDPNTIANHESALWIALVAAGCLVAADVRDFEVHRARLQQATVGLPPVLEVRHRHVTREDEDFIMEPGFVTFAPVQKGQVVARDRKGSVATPDDGLMMLPRYQGQGEDGFFLARPVSRIWLSVSAVLRSVRADWLVPWLPGVHRDPDRQDTVVVDRNVARLLVVPIFHLFGFRRRSETSQCLEFSRRRPDHRGSAVLPLELARARNGSLETAAARE